MTVKEVLLLGNPKLYEISKPVEKSELREIKTLVDDLHDTLMDFKDKYGAGRAIAAPQIGIMKRLIYMYTNESFVFINPSLDKMNPLMMEVWDDCMCFPDLLVRVYRHKTCTISYYDMEWEKQEMDLEDHLSELLQHECDHLDGILAVSKAIDGKSFALRSQKEMVNGF